MFSLLPKHFLVGLRQIVCLARGHDPSWVLAVALAPNRRPPRKPVCRRCLRSVDV